MKTDIQQQLQNNIEEHKTLMEKIDKLTEKLEEVRINIAEMPDKILERTDTRYASKDTEDSVKRLGWIVISAVVVAILSIVIKEF